MEGRNVDAASLVSTQRLLQRSSSEVTQQSCGTDAFGGKKLKVSSDSTTHAVLYDQLNPLWPTATSGPVSSARK